MCKKATINKLQSQQKVNFTFQILNRFKMKHLLSLFGVLLTALTLQAQTVDEIITDYYNAIGGAN
ncbi:MAG: hypothetical protein EBU82_07755, partial [Flavobacteriia bacterium]|nr:hypothetical protein [Flavobacteriia bacterium]